MVNYIFMLEYLQCHTGLHDEVDHDFIQQFSILKSYDGQWVLFNGNPWEWGLFINRPLLMGWCLLNWWERGQYLLRAMISCSEVFSSSVYRRMQSNYHEK